MSLNESIVEVAALEWFGELGYVVGRGPHIAPGEAAAESACASPADRRDSFGEVVLVGRLREAIRRLNPAIPSRTLATLRDTLLPKLLSGELSVAGIESKLEAVT
jgi:type I restriction enzyme R subunit